MGLGDALNIGLQNCTYELVARMDTDDIAKKDRFAKQLKVFTNNSVDVCSSWVSEFDNDEENITSYRKVPEYHEEIVNFAKKRNPINHPAVMYKKTSVINAGGYQKMMWFEDYYLWCRMILNGAKFYNIQEPLVSMRAGYSQLERRSGFKYVIAEYKFLTELNHLGFLTKTEYYLNLLKRIPVRMMPKVIVKYIYFLIRK
jgi:glycosyltransferase involved in cell wall biosynthesis